MPYLSLSLTYLPTAAEVTTEDVAALLGRVDSAYRSAGLASRFGHQNGAELWNEAQRHAAPVVAGEVSSLIAEVEYLERAIRRERGEGASAFAANRALGRVLGELDEYVDSGSRPRRLPPLECLRLRMESPLALLLGIPDAFVFAGGISGVGALLALLEKQANVFGRIKLERETLRLGQTQTIFEREQLEEERRAWHAALNEGVDEPSAGGLGDERNLDTFTLDWGVLDSRRPEPGTDEIAP